MKALAGLAIMIAIILVVFLAIPLPSFQRFVVLTNQLTSQAEIRCATASGRREKTFHLSPGEQLKYVYYAGDHDKRVVIQVTIAVKRLVDGRMAQKQFDLPINNQPPGITVSEDWFTPEKK